MIDTPVASGDVYVECFTRHVIFMEYYMKLRFSVSTVVNYMPQQHIEIILNIRTTVAFKYKTNAKLGYKYVCCGTT